MNSKHPTDPAQLSRWLRTPRTAQTPAEYAAAVHREEVQRVGVTADRVIFWFGIVMAILAALHFAVGYMGA